jgi:hypothetical protein
MEALKTLHLPAGANVESRNVNGNLEITLFGAGICLRRELAEHYVHHLQKKLKASPLDRKGWRDVRETL